MKYIPIPSKESYQLNLIDKIREIFGFKSRKCPPTCSNFIPFEKDLTDMVTLIKFRDGKDSFQHELNEDIKIKSSPNVFVFADKTNNIYKMSKDHHQKLLHDNVTKTYQKAPLKLEASINLEAKGLSIKLQISDRV